MKRTIHRLLATCLTVLVSPLAVLGQVDDLPGVRARFPRQMLVSGARIVAHAPQVESWKNHETIVAWQALEATLLDDDQPHVGVAKIRANTQINMRTRIIYVRQVEVLQLQFPGVPVDRLGKLKEAATEALQSHRGTVPLDLALAYIARQQEETRSIELEATPPEIHVADSPTLLVLLEGEPAFAMVVAGLWYAVNTNWDLFHHPASGSYYLRDGDRWLTAPALDGDWQNALALPEELSKLPATGRWVRARELALAKPSDEAVSAVLIRTQPTELILTDGPPVFREFPDTFLSYVDNSESDVFLELTTGTYYYLVAGRWFQAPELNGPWTAAGPLPADFDKIPPDGPRADVLASVPGTWEARMAVQEARIPRKASIDPSKARMQTLYDGEPQFEPIPGTSVSRAANTSDTVLRVGTDYYACKQAVWFVGSTPAGPWRVAREIPDAINGIPPSSPAFPVTFVRIYGQGRGRITFGYTPGYERIYMGGGVVVFGAGHYHKGYLNPEGEQPVYYPGFSPYGVGAYYDLYASSYRRTRPGPYAGADVRDVGRKNAYSSWGNTVARLEEDRAGTSQKLASRPPGYVSPPPEQPDAGLGADLYVGSDQEVYERKEDRWSRVGSETGQNISGGLTLDEEEHARYYFERRRAEYNARKNAKRARRSAW